MRTKLYLSTKRFIDIFISLFNLLFLSLFFIIIIALIKLNTKGQAIFKQKRVEKDGKLFTLYKFRTMIEGADKLKKKYQHLNEVDGPIFKIKDDPRFTKIGKKLSMGIDELPQLFNVLKGNMSLIGPRPPTPDEVKQYKPWQLKRLSIKPGITSLWHISGRHKMGFDNWVRSDIYYIKNQSLKLDLFILYKTFIIFFKKFLKKKFLRFFFLYLIKKITTYKKPFNGDVYLKKEIEKLIKKFDIKTIVETGTFYGDTTKELSKMVDFVYSIESNEEYYSIASKKLGNYRNISILLGNSPEILKKILPKLKKPILFYIDAHWYDYWPILDELNTISKFKDCKNSIIVIHDFYVPEKKFKFDNYNFRRLDFDFVKEKIWSINPNFKYYYNSKATGEKIGVIYIHP